MGWLIAVGIALAARFSLTAEGGGAERSNPGVSAPMLLRWNAEAARMTASVRRVPLSRVLGRLARTTGWRILIEPDTQRSVDVAFTNLPPSSALPRLFGDFSFSFAPSGRGGRELRIYRSTAAAATSAVDPIDDEEFQARPGPIPNEWIVRLKPGSKLSPEELAKRLGARLVGRIDDLRTFRLRFDSAEDAANSRPILLGEPDVAGLESNIRLPIPEPGVPGTAPGEAVTLKPRAGGSGDQVVVALIDTSVQSLNSNLESLLLNRVSVAEGTAAADGAPTHGTVMAQDILQGVGRTDSGVDGTQVRILPVDVYGADSATTTWNVVRGLEAAAARGATVFNLSLGGAEDSPLLDEVIASIRAQGGLVLAATGNTPGVGLTYPAASPGALGVTAVDSTGMPASYANTGPQARLAGPGTTLIQYGGLNWVTQGTSGATAWVSGLAAGWMSQSGATASQAGQWLQGAVPFKPPTGK
jgi:hypothetical protein